MEGTTLNTWVGKSISVIGDCNFAERQYLFQQSQILKDALRCQNEEILSKFCIDDPSFRIYEIFLEDSTRTKESFRSAANFHRVTVNDLISSNSSLNKYESFRDTFHTLIGYDNRVFIVRSTQEGLCRWLTKSSREYCKRMDIDKIPAFINAGDGSHEHPTQELMDDFTFLEDLDWSYEKIHIALIGDLLHGRTVHSKVDGLQIFAQVKVDLIAPREMALPQNYYQNMEVQGFQLRSFSCIDEYLEQENIAPIWYFTRLQLERMDETILRRELELRRSVTLRQDHLPTLDLRQQQQNIAVRFYHPLPRHKEFPVIPPFLDNSPYNAWERQSANGRIVRIVLLALIAGLRPPPSELFPEPISEDRASELYRELPVSANGEQKVYSEGLRPIRNGIVIDHILRGFSPEEIRRHMGRITELMGLDRYRGGQWVGASHAPAGEEPPVYKGLIFVPEAKPFEREELRKLAAIAPHITINYIQDSRVQRKYYLLQPPRIYGFAETRCHNSNCISHVSHHEGVDPEFIRKEEGDFVCLYCNTKHNFQEIWDA